MNMDMSEDRLEELLDRMLDNCDEEGRCIIPTDISEEEQEALTLRISMMTMQDRIDNVLSAILSSLKSIELIQEVYPDLDLLEQIKMKDNLDKFREGSEILLMDIHSEDVISNLFKIQLKVTETQGVEYVDKLRLELESLIEEEFNSQIELIKGYCKTIINIIDNLNLE